MNKKTDIFKCITAMLPILLLSVMSYLLSRFMVDKNKYIVQVVLFIIYCFYLLYLYKKINSYRQMFGFVVYSVVLLVISIIGAIPLPVKLPDNLFYNIVGGVLDCAFSIIFQPIRYLCVRIPIYQYMIMSLVVYIFFCLYFVRYLRLKGERNKYNILLLVIFVTIIDMQTACLTTILPLDYHHIILPVCTWLVWIYGIWHFRYHGKVLSAISKCWLYVFCAQAILNIIIDISQLLPENIRFILYHAGVNHIFYYVILPFLCGGFRKVESALLLISLCMVFTLFVLARIFEKRLKIREI